MSTDDLGAKIQGNFNAVPSTSLAANGPGNINAANLLSAKGAKLPQQAANPGDVNTLWINSADGHLYKGAIDIEAGTTSGFSTTPFGDSSTDLIIAPAGSVTLAEDGYYRNVTLGNGSILHTAGYKVYINGTLTGGSATLAIIDNSGNIGDAATIAGVGAGGTGGSGGSLGNGTNGATGVNGGMGAAGSTVAYGIAAGGAGGTGISPGGAGGTVIDVPTSEGGIKCFTANKNPYQDLTTNQGNKLNGGGGGGSGGTAAAGIFSGGGGGGGGIVFIAAKTIAGIITVRANGGAGGVPYGAGAAVAGGSGGGGGGFVFVVSNTDTTTLPGFITSVTGGAGSAGIGVGGTAGVTGITGVAHIVKI